MGELVIDEVAEAVPDTEPEPDRLSDADVDPDEDEDTVVLDDVDTVDDTV